MYLAQAIAYDDARAGAAVAVQSFGDFQYFHPHLHVLATDGCFCNDTAFMVCPPPDTGALEKLFRYEVFEMLKAEGKITGAIIENMMNWRHSGFNVYCGNVKKIPKHLDLWEVGRKPPACANRPPSETFIIYDETSSPSADDYLIDASYPMQSYL